MDLKPIVLGIGILGLAGGAARAEPLRAPENINAEPSTPGSRKLTSQAASAEIQGDPAAALDLAERAITADAQDPWARYDKATALYRLGRTDQALAAFSEAEERFAVSDVWARSIAIYGRAHALEQAGRCDEGRKELERYATFVRERDARSADLAVRYEADCRTSAPTK